MAFARRAVKETSEASSVTAGFHHFSEPCLPWFPWQPSFWMSRNAYTKKCEQPSPWLTRCVTNQKTETIINPVAYRWKSKHSLSLALADGILQNYEIEEVSFLFTALLIPSFLLPVRGPQGWNPRGSPAQLDNSWCKPKVCCPRKDQNLEESTAV